MDPRRPHAYRAAPDAGLGTGLGGMTARGATTLDQVAMTNAYVRPPRCSVEGCGKDRDDAIHQPVD